jgi:hypothetical protein
VEKVRDASKIDEDKLRNILEDDIDRSENYYNALVKTQRERGYIAYYGQRLGNEQEGRSNHISKDVFNSVEQSKSMVVETFTANKQAVYFPPRNPDDYLLSELANSYVNYVFYNLNKGEKIIEDVAHDALVAKKGVCKVWWNVATKYSDETFQEITAEELEALQVQEDVIDIQAEAVMKEVPDQVKIQQFQQQMQSDPNFAQENQTEFIKLQKNPPMRQMEVYSGEVKRELDVSGVKMEVVAPEDFLIDPYAKSLKSFDFVAQRNMIARSDLFEMGFDPADIEKVKSDDREGLGWYLQEKQARTDFDQSYDYFERNAATLDREKVVLYECYRKIDLNGDGISELYQIMYCGGVIMSVEQVGELPFYDFDCFPIPHKFYGLSYPDVLFDIQKSKSTIERQIIDNMALTNNTRYIADLGFVRNPRDLVDSRIGGVINVTNMDAVRPMPIATLNPQAFSVIEMLEVDKELATGITRLNQGMNQDVVSKQNSSNLIEAMASSGSRRSTKLVKDFADQFLKPLFHAIYRLGQRYESKEKVFRVHGNYVKAEPSDFVERTDLEIEVALTTEEQKKKAQDLLMLHTTLTQSAPQLALNYGPSQQYFLFQKMMTFMGIDCREQVLLSPASPEYQQASQQQQQQQQQEQEKADAVFQADLQQKNVGAQAMGTQAQAEMIKAQAQAQKGMMTANSEKDIDEEKMNLSWRKQDWDEEMDQKNFVLDKMKLEKDFKEIELKAKTGSGI